MRGAMAVLFAENFESLGRIGAACRPVLDMVGVEAYDAAAAATASVLAITPALTFRHWRVEPFRACRWQLLP